MKSFWLCGNFKGIVTRYSKDILRFFSDEWDPSYMSLLHDTYLWHSSAVYHSLSVPEQPNNFSWLPNMQMTKVAWEESILCWNVSKLPPFQRFPITVSSISSLDIRTRSQGMDWWPDGLWTNQWTNTEHSMVGHDHKLRHVKEW